MSTSTTLYATPSGILAANGTEHRLLRDVCFDEIFQSREPRQRVAQAWEDAARCAAPTDLLAPIQSQEVWAAGVTYLRSRDARMEESKNAGGETFYDRVYVAERPEIFFKATPHRVVAPGGSMRLRSDSKWNVPEPELTLAISAHGEIFGYTVGNDLSSRDIEGENPLYLPQAKVWGQCCALGPGLVVRPELPADTAIRMSIERSGEVVYNGETSLSQMKRSPEQLRDWLLRDNAFPAGAYLMTGTGMVPPDSFTLHGSDAIRISIEGLGSLLNTIA
jgi:2-dehydro-3-deoxy-D-arabinonate dehydratase